MPAVVGQKAPSAKRCIKTRPLGVPLLLLFGLVRKHRAPYGALRREGLLPRRSSSGIVRKHRAPKGVLRQLKASLFARVERELQSTERHKVRCIKTGPSPHPRRQRAQSLKAASTKRRIKTGEEEPLRVHATNRAERTERHKVH